MMQKVHALNTAMLLLALSVSLPSCANALKCESAVDCQHKMMTAHGMLDGYCKSRRLIPTCIDGTCECAMPKKATINE